MIRPCSIPLPKEANKIIEATHLEELLYKDYIKLQISHIFLLTPHTKTGSPTLADEGEFKLSLTPARNYQRSVKDLIRNIGASRFVKTSQPKEYFILRFLFTKGGKSVFDISFNNSGAFCYFSGHYYKAEGPICKFISDLNKSYFFQATR